MIVLPLPRMSLIVSVVHISAQDTLPVTVGTRVRVTAPGLDIDKYDATLPGQLRVMVSFGLDYSSGSCYNLRRTRDSAPLLCSYYVAVSVGLTTNPEAS